MILILLNLLRSVLCPRLYGQYCYMFHGYLERMCIMPLLRGMFYKCQLDPNWIELLVDGVVEFFYVCWFFVNVFYPSQRNSMYNYRFVYFFFQFCRSLLHMFCSCFCGTNTFSVAVFSFINCYVFFYHYIMSFSVSGDFLCSKVYFFWY